ncbi:hypothetical protein H310_06486 [Aphanomyces invadans]|uniref:Uncharacterized protein n=1 Tax=Aphanomyces invadans TaxID=157072 RepID=A0A024U7V9_9STRA|nr:hypothetical protein H310_06486 [Aphanomyces invadans]ETW01957.1 hypothetical protein H310_06486 [Aphanomyces invadans]|eukprot:XP_008869805.1 hypothetical protein H310_06486 [Aphanomyces invadans]
MPFFRFENTPPFKSRHDVVLPQTTSLSQTKVDNITAKNVIDAAYTGDQVIQDVVDEVADSLGFASVSFCRTLDRETNV